MKKMQTFSGTPISLIHTPFDRACDGDQEYHPLIISSPSFPDKNYEILREGRNTKKWVLPEKELYLHQGTSKSLAVSIFRLGIKFCIGQCIFQLIQTIE